MPYRQRQDSGEDEPGGEADIVPFGDEHCGITPVTLIMEEFMELIVLKDAFNSACMDCKEDCKEERSASKPLDLPPMNMSLERSTLFASIRTVAELEAGARFRVSNKKSFPEVRKEYVPLA